MNEHGAEKNHPRAQVIAVLTAHDQRAQNMEGDWLCACGSFLCPPDDDRLDNCHREHLATIITRRVIEPVRKAHDVASRVHNHPPYRPVCNERDVNGQLRGACLNDDGTGVLPPAAPRAEDIAWYCRQCNTPHHIGSPDEGCGECGFHEEVQP